MCESIIFDKNTGCRITVNRQRIFRRHGLREGGMFSVTFL